MEFFVDPSRCIGCQACVQACSECDTHRGVAMIHLDEIDREYGPETVPTVCMHCEDPTCARVCPADAIKVTPDGVVQSSLKPRCIACSNCVMACPFGVPRYRWEPEQMMKCDLCYDRTALGKKPLCATVCPSQALFYGPREQVLAGRRAEPVNTFRFGNQVVTTRVHLMLPRGSQELAIDVATFVDQAAGGSMMLPIIRAREGVGQDG